MATISMLDLFSHNTTHSFTTSMAHVKILILKLFHHKGRLTLTICGNYIRTLSYVGRIRFITKSWN